MPKQLGVFVISGTMDNATFRRSPNGYIVGKKSSLDPARILTDPKFQRTRENIAEFRTAVAATKLIRKAFNNAVLNAKDVRTHTRLTARCFDALQKDLVNPRGQRTLPDGDMQQLRFYEFNNNALVDSVIVPQVITAIDRVTGEVELSLPSYEPVNEIKAPLKTTHYKIVLTAAEIDLVNRSYTKVVTKTGYLPWNETPTAALNLTGNLPAASTLPLILCVGVEFFQELNGTQYALKDGSHNALQIAQVDA